MLVLEQERKERCRLEKKNRELNERIKRIHDIKWAQIGIDREALAKQIEEKKKHAEYERKSLQTYEENRLAALEKALELEKREEATKREVEKQILQYRKEYQAPHMRDSYDLNNPCALKECAYPDRNDPHVVGSSSLLMMNGEDPDVLCRTRNQQEQFRTWLDQQIIEKCKLEQERLYSDSLHMKHEEELQKHLCDMKKKEMMETLRIQQEIQEFNKKLAEEKTKKICEENPEKPEGDGYTLQSSQGPVLTNDRAVPRSSLGGGHIVATMFKGFSPEENIKCREALKEQIEEFAKRKEEESRREYEYTKQYVKTYRDNLLHAKAFERQAKQIARQVYEENKRLAEEQRSRRKEIDRTLGRSEISDEFFKQFEKSP